MSVSYWEEEAVWGIQSEFNVRNLDDTTHGDTTEDPRRFSGVTRKAYSYLLESQWDQIWFYHSQRQHAGGSRGPVQRLLQRLLMKRMIFHCWSLCGHSIIILHGIPRTMYEKREAYKRTTSKLEVLNEH